uniref:Quinolinate phosphoribosyl transferase C-terminal domain-containing protein n=1 Tax=Salarias fasciatus TaxID=181472 RepID=A0A672G8E6_SALFA
MSSPQHLAAHSLPRHALTRLAQDWLAEDTPGLDPAGAVSAARSVCGFSSKIEVECGSAEEGREAAGAGADVVMLDNLQPQELHAAARTLKDQFPALLIEASGGVTPENLALYFSPHVDVVSLGCITQGCPVADFSLKIQKSGGDSKLLISNQTCKQ